MTDQSVFVSSGILPIDRVIVKKQITCRLSGTNRDAGFYIDIDLTVPGKEVICRVSVRNAPSFDRFDKYKILETKEETLRLIETTVNTLKTELNTPELPDLIGIYNSEDWNLSLISALRKIEKSIINFNSREQITNRLKYGRYLGVVSSVTKLSVAYLKGDLVPITDTYKPNDHFESGATQLLYDSIANILKQ